MGNLQVASILLFIMDTLFFPANDFNRIFRPNWDDMGFRLKLINTIRYKK